MECDLCQMPIKVGTAGQYNLDQHRLKCTRRPNHKIDNMFTRVPKATLVPPTVTAPPLVNVIFSTRKDPVPSIAPDSGLSPAPHHPLLASLRIKMANIPRMHPQATIGHSLAIFAPNPQTFFNGGDSRWTGTLNLILVNTFHGRISGASEVPCFDLFDIYPLLNRGSYGLDGFCNFFDYFAEGDREKAGMILECTQVSCETRWHHRACFPSHGLNMKNWKCEITSLDFWKPVNTRREAPEVAEDGVRRPAR
ncbi:hypothetical protein K438DRAFT_1768229 [Mycena galopus ATCC 62051]|nr:hypothetical protein K438DRAFT_1768229 [Mycena galopus ATCC 62051]